MRTDTTVKTHRALTIHLGDAVDKLGPLSYTINQINGALEKDCTLGVPLKEQVIREFNKVGVQTKKIQKGPTSIRKRVVAVFLSSLPKELVNSIVKGKFC